MEGRMLPKRIKPRRKISGEINLTPSEVEEIISRHFNLELKIKYIRNKSPNADLQRVDFCGILLGIEDFKGDEKAG